MEWLKSYGESLGFRAEIFEENQEGLRQANLLLRPRAETAPDTKEILFQTHMDTVEPGNYGAWSKTQANPFQVNVYGDEMYGLGVADVKLDFLCKMEAAREFVDRPFRRPFVLAATYGAQTGMSGAIRLLRKKLIRPEWAFVGEPTDLRVAAAGMGLATVDLFVPFGDEEMSYRESHDVMESSSTQSKVFLGKAAHSSNPQSGESALFKALEYLSQLPSGLVIMDLDGGINDNSVPSQAFLEVDFVGSIKAPTAEKLVRIYECLKELEVKMKSHRDERFTPDHATLNLGTVRTSSSGIHISGSCRVPPSVTDLIYREWMSHLEALCMQLGVRFSIREYRRGFDATASAFAAQVCGMNEALGLSARMSTISTTTEASVFAKMGIACVAYGAGRSLGNSHQPNERVKVSDLLKSIAFYKEGIKRFCL